LSDQNPGIRSFNPVVGECNDGFLNDIVGRHVNKSHLLNAIDQASETEFSEGVVGAGVGMTGFRL
jgi:D-aminopeptidase